MAYWNGTTWVPEPAAAPSARRPAPGRVLGGATDWIATAAMVSVIPVLVIALAGGALAAKPTVASLNVTPNHAQAWSTATGSGCGYTAAEVYVDIHKPEALAFMSVVPDTAGCINFTFNTDGPGDYLLETRQRGNGKHWRTMATYALPVD